MVNHHLNGANGGGNSSGSLRGTGGDYSGDDRSASGGGGGAVSGERDERDDLHDKPIYLLEHLATFTVNKESGIVYPADGMRRLLQLEKTTGIWSQKMQLCLDYQWVLIMDYETGNVIERFPAALIQDPTAFTSTDAMELYNNILVFIVSGGGGGSRSEMHIFQSQSVSAVHLVEDLKSLRSGKLITQQRGTTPTHAAHGSPAGGGRIGKAVAQRHEQLLQQQSQHHNHHPHQHQSPHAHARHQHPHHQQQQHQHQHHQQQQRGSIDQYGLRNNSNSGHHPAELELAAAHHGLMNGETDSELGVAINDETSSTGSEKYLRDVAVLNHCFDDIEKFIARLQHAAAAVRELDRRRRDRKSKKRDPGEGLLTLRSRPPHEKEFVDVFAKFKLSFNLLAKLKAHIHDPNAPELVHFLFTPLALLVEACGDTYYDAHLPARVINPLLTRDAINLLNNCMTSKESELWRSLGDAWNIPRDQWKDDVGSYHPVFMNGWSPDYLVVEELETPLTPTNIGKRRLDGLTLNGRGGGGGAGIGVIAGAHGGGGGAYDDYETNGVSLSDKYTIHHGNERSENNDEHASFDVIDRGGPSVGPGNAPSLSAITAGLQNLHTREPRNTSSPYGAGSAGNNMASAAAVATAQSAELAGGAYGGRGGAPAHHANEEQLLESWLEDLQTSGAKIVLVTYPRTANNDKELTVARGEYLEVLDDTRKWWKARNMRGQVAHVPHTIVTPYNYGDNEQAGQYYGQQTQPLKGRHSAGSNADNRDQRSPDPADMIRNKHIGKKGEFRYF